MWGGYYRSEREVLMWLKLCLTADGASSVLISGAFGCSHGRCCSPWWELHGKDLQFSCTWSIKNVLQTDELLGKVSRAHSPCSLGRKSCGFWERGGENSISVRRQSELEDPLRCSSIRESRAAVCCGKTNGFSVKMKMIIINILAKLRLYWSFCICVGTARWAWQMCLWYLHERTT